MLSSICSVTCSCTQIRAAGSNLRMVRPGSMSTVKPLIIRAREARAKILDLANYLAVRRRSHCTSASNWGLPLLCFPALQGSSSLIKCLISATSFSSSYCNKGHDLYHAPIAIVASPNNIHYVEKLRNGFWSGSAI